jgi:hypothetical protein
LHRKQEPLDECLGVDRGHGRCLVCHGLTIVAGLL